MIARSLCIAAALVAIGCGAKPDPAAPESLPSGSSAISSSRDEDPELKEAITKARETLDSFLARLARPHEREVFSVEGKFAAEDGTPQYLWLGDVAYKDGAFEGTVTSHPKKATAVKYGDKTTVKRENVTDWMILTSGQSEGGYTTDVLIRREGQPR